MTIHWKAVEQYFGVVLFVFQFYLVCKCGKFIHFGIGTVRSEMVNGVHYKHAYEENYKPACCLHGIYLMLA